MEWCGTFADCFHMILNISESAGLASKLSGENPETSSITSPKLLLDS